MPNLKRYRDKRDPEATPEPFGDDGPRQALPAGAPRAFVVQQHDARNMHWDLRLEIDGVLTSWAIPKGPTLDPSQKRLAVQTEDHPLEYAHFEGIIPTGNYGAGAMIVWDLGTYTLVDGASPGDGLASGKLDLLLRGHKLHGRFALVRTRGEGGRHWLLLRKGDPDDGEGELIERQPSSVFSGLRIDELRDGVSRSTDVASLLERTGAPTAELDRKHKPMLASRCEEPFSREGWLFELKYDGVRAFASVGRDGEPHLRMRSGRDATALYPEVTRALRHLPLGSFGIDGELVALDERGQPSFERIQRRFTQTDPSAIGRLEFEAPVVFYAFDLLFAEGRELRDLRALPLAERKEVLAVFAPRVGVVRFADHVEGDGVSLYEAAREHGLEGVIAKRADSRYESGRRSKAWQKIRVPRIAQLAIVGYAPRRGASRNKASIGSLMLAWHWPGTPEGELRYAGHAGSGLSERVMAELLPLLEEARQDTPAFRTLGTLGGMMAPRGSRASPARESVFSEPRLVCEVRYTEVTSAGQLRHPVFLRVRDDLDLRDCQAPADRSVPEVPAPDPEASGSAASPATKLAITRAEKVFWPVEGYTKGDLLAYYEAIWPWLAPYLRDRPLVLTRYPDGIEGKFFYQKNAPEFTPEWVLRESIEGTDYFICNELRTLLYVINSGAIPLHVWSARLGDLERPDWLILDLDPKEAPFADVIRVARHIHALLDELAAPHAVKTSGQSGIHVMLPLGGRLGHAETRTLGEVLARTVVAELPDIATIARPIAARADKVYVDFLQNGRGKLIAAPFSVRPRAAAPVSAPLRWSQVTARLRPERFTIKTLIALMKKRGDPFGRVLGEGVDVEALLEALTSRLAGVGDD